MSKPSRKVVTHSPKRTVGRINCRWVQSAPVEHESRLEKHFVLRALLYAPLTSIYHQPFKLTLGPDEWYTPDFMLTFTDGQRAVVEVKRAEKVKPLIERLDRISAEIAKTALRFYVIHHGQIEGGMRAYRAGLVRRYATLPVPDSSIEAAVRLLKETPAGVAIGTVCSSAHLTRPQMLALVARRVVTLNSDLLMSEDDLLFPAVKEVRDAADQFGDWFGCAPWRAHP